MEGLNVSILAFLSLLVHFFGRARQLFQHCAMAVCFKVLLQCNLNVWTERQEKKTNITAGKELQNIQVGYLDSECHYPNFFQWFALKWQNQTMEVQNEPNCAPF